MTELKQPAERRTGHDADRVGYPRLRQPATAEAAPTESEHLQQSLGNRGTKNALEHTPAAAASGDALWYLANDATAKLEPGQARRADFLRALERVVYRTAEHGLAPLGRTSRDCPYLRAWFRFYARRDTAHVSAALRRYAPETAWAGSAAEARRMVALRVRDGVRVWASTGRIERTPEWGDTEGGMVASQIRSGLGEPLPGTVRGRMEQAFGESFSAVRIHTGGPAAEFAAEQKARAVTIGQDVYFARDQFRPGTLTGDAILAHELAHVAQQRGGGSTAGPIVDRGGSREFERDADQAAGAAVHSIWTKSLRATAQVLRRASVSLHSGLSLQRCGSSSKTPSTPTADTSPITFASSNYTPSGTGQLKIGSNPNPKLATVPEMAVETPDYKNKVDVATSGGSDVEATDYQAGYVQTLTKSDILFTYEDASGRQLKLADGLQAAARDGVLGTTAPWYDSAHSTRTFPSADSQLHLDMQDTPGKTIPWGGGTTHLAATSGRDEFCTWLGVQHVSANKMTYLNWNTWSVDWAATYKPNPTGTSAGQGGQLGPQGTGQGSITPVEGGKLAKELMVGLHRVP